MTTVRKQGYCSYCSVMIEAATFFVPNNVNAHIQHVKIVAVCDRCQKATELNYGYQDLLEKKAVQTEKCAFCGGSISPSDNICHACQATTFTISTGDTGLSLTTGNLTAGVTFGE